MRGIGFIDYRNKLRQPRAYLRHSTCDQALDGGQYDFVPLTICFEDHGVFRNEEPHRYPRSGFDLVAVRGEDRWAIARLSGRPRRLVIRPRGIPHIQTASMPGTSAIARG